MYTTITNDLFLQCSILSTLLPDRSAPHASGSFAPEASSFYSTLTLKFFAIFFSLLDENIGTTAVHGVGVENSDA